MTVMGENSGTGIRILFAEARSLVFQVTDAEGDYETEAYEVRVNGAHRFTSCKTIETIYDLKPDTLYRIGIMRGGSCSGEAGSVQRRNSWF